MRNLAAGFPSNVRIDGIDSGVKRGPAFVGQVFSMCDPSGTGLMAVSSKIELPFLSRTPDWVKKLFALVTKNDMNGPVFRFFLDIGDAVGYVKRLNIPSGMVGACRLDVAYEHFKEKPHMFQFVPNEKQVREANKLLRTNSHRRKDNHLKGVPVFTAQNLSIAIATTNGIRWYTPYFFDKRLLDNILEVSVDQHFQSLIQNRHIRRRREMTDDDFPTEMIEEHFESLLDPPEAVLDSYDSYGYAEPRHFANLCNMRVLSSPAIVTKTAAAVSRARELSLGIRTELKEEVEGGGLDKNGEITSLFGPESKEREKPNEQIHSKSSQKSLRSDTAEERSNKSDHK